MLATEKFILIQAKGIGLPLRKLQDKPTTDFPGKASQAKGAVTLTRLLLTIGWMSCLDPSQPSSSNIHHVLFFCERRWHRPDALGERLFVLPYARSCKPLYTILPNCVPCQWRTHVFTTQSLATGQTVVLRFSMAARVNGRDIKKYVLETPRSAQKWSKGKQNNDVYKERYVIGSALPPPVSIIS